MAVAVNVTLAPLAVGVVAEELLSEGPEVILGAVLEMTVKFPERGLLVAANPWLSMIYA